MSKSLTVTITPKFHTKARKLAKTKGLDLADKRVLPTTISKAIKLASKVDKSIAASYGAQIASTILALPVGEYTAATMFSAIRCGKSKSELHDLTGSNAQYDAFKFLRNGALSYIVTGNMPDSNEARRVNLDDGTVRDKPEPKTPTGSARGAKQRKTGGVTPAAVHLADSASNRVTTDNDGDVIAIKEFKPRDVQNAMAATMQAAFIAQITSSALVMSLSNDADARGVAMDDLIRQATACANELLNHKSVK